jgi:hypothetical protein
MVTFCSLPLTLAAVLLAGTWPGAAATATWTSLSGGNWSTAANSRPNTAPGSADTALITETGACAVSLDTSATITCLVLLDSPRLACVPFCEACAINFFPTSKTQRNPCL